MKVEFVKKTIPSKKNIALVAHDNEKDIILNWAYNNKEELKKHSLCGTGTTAKLIAEKTGLNVHGYLSGPIGGDQQIGANIATGDIDILVFFWDPLEAQPHDPDVKALLRIAVLHNIPIANNTATADFLIKSEFMDKEYERYDIK